jgi:hypothetical protein
MRYRSPVTVTYELETDDDLFVVNIEGTAVWSPPTKGNYSSRAQDPSEYYGDPGEIHDFIIDDVTVDDGRDQVELAPWEQKAFNRWADHWVTTREGEETIEEQLADVADDCADYDEDDYRDRQEQLWRRYR